MFTLDPSSFPCARKSLAVRESGYAPTFWLARASQTRSISLDFGVATTVNSPIRDHSCEYLKQRNFSLNMGWARSRLPLFYRREIERYVSFAICEKPTAT